MKTDRNPNRRNLARSLALRTLLAAMLWLVPAIANSQAIQAWVQRFPGPGENPSDPAMVLDGSGNVIVTGASYAGEPLPAFSDDWLTTKYSPAGVPLWTNRYDGPAHLQDWPTAVTVDASGNVFVAGSMWVAPEVGGSRCTTVKYSLDGAPLWSRHVESSSAGGKFLVVDGGGNAIVTSQTLWNGSGYEVQTLKYSSAGVVLWNKRHGEIAAAYDDPAAMAVDADGNVVVAVRSSSFVTIKYSSAGAPLWTNRYPMDPYGRSVLALDRGGNVLVTGSEQRAGTYRDIVTIKYSSAGVPLWTNLYNGPANGSDSPCGVAVDASDNVYVAGTAETATISDYVTIKYSSAGVLLWTNLYGRPGNHVDGAIALAVDAAGNVVVTGKAGSDWATVAYSSSGSELWTMFHSPSGGSGWATWPTTLAVDSAGGVYVTGLSGVSETGTHKVDVVTIKYVTPPIITRQPLSCTNAVGTTASFSVEVAGSAPFSYQWRRDGTDLVDGGDISGVTTTNLLIANAQPGDAVGYSVVITNAYGSVTSIVAQLTVVVPPNPGRFTNFTYSPIMGFSFIFRDATVGQPYRIQRSPSAAPGSWTDWQSFIYTEPNAFTDLGATGLERRFYRAVSP